MKPSSTPENNALVDHQYAAHGWRIWPCRSLRTWLMTVPLALITVIAFLPELGNGFVNWDDEINFVDNPHFRGLGLAQMKWAWTTFWLGVYQPLAWLFFEAEYTFWKLDPRGYHLTSVVLHTANAIVLYILTVSLLVRCRLALWLKSPWTCLLGSWFATAFFVVHPLRVEPVAWASCQPYLPCAFFFHACHSRLSSRLRRVRQPPPGLAVGLIRDVRRCPFITRSCSEPSSASANSRCLFAPSVRERVRRMAWSTGVDDVAGKDPVHPDKPRFRGTRHRSKESGCFFN